MEIFDRVKFVNGSKTEPKVQYGYYVATIPSKLRKNAAKVIVLDQDLNAKRVKEVSLIEDVSEPDIFAGIDMSTANGVPFFSFIHGWQVAHKSTGGKPYTAMSPSLNESLQTKVLKNGDKVEVRSLKSEDWEADCTFVGMLGGGYVVSDKFNELQLRTYCRKQKPAEKILPPSHHFGGAEQFYVTENYGTWRRGDVVKYIGSEDDEPLKWTFEKLYPKQGRKKFTGKIRFKHLAPMIF